jgi:Spx/MgsR family transcriptional regulator
MSKRVTIYGIKACDTMKKARTWLDGHGVAYDFHDYKAAGISQDVLENWSAAVGWETLLNRSGTTFRKLPDEARQNLTEAKAGPAFDDQAARTGDRRRRTVGRLQTRRLRGVVRLNGINSNTHAPRAG